MKYRFLPCFLLPLCATAQLAPPVNLRASQTLQMSTADIPVDAAVITGNARLPSNNLLVLTQGSNQMYTYGQGRTQNFIPFLFPDQMATAPLSILTLPGGGVVDDALVLTADGLVQTWRNSGVGRFQTGTPVALRQGLRCALTDRLVMGRYAPSSVGNDLLCWSEGPQRGLARARYLGNGAYQAQAPLSLSGINVQPGGEAVTANLNTNGLATETLFMVQPTDSTGRYLWWLNNQSPAWWGSVQYYRPQGTGPNRGLAVGQIDGGRGLDLVLLRRYLTVYRSTSTIK